MVYPKQHLASILHWPSVICQPWLSAGANLGFFEKIARIAKVGLPTLAQYGDQTLAQH